MVNPGDPQIREVREIREILTTTYTRYQVIKKPSELHDDSKYVIIRRPRRCSLLLSLDHKSQRQLL